MIIQNNCNIDFAKTEIGDAVYVGSEIESTMDFVTKNQVKGIIISHDKGFRNTNVDFLKKYNFIENLIIQYYGKIDLSAIHSLRNLKRLVLNVVAYDNQPIDFTKFPKIETCMFDWRPKAKSIFRCKTLVDLRISKFRKDDLTDFFELSNLKVLFLSSSSINTLKGIENLNLNRFQLSYCSNLKSLSNIDGLKSTLKELEIYSCKNLNSIKEVESLEYLEKLGVVNCGKVESIKPIQNLIRLEDFYFYDDTNIIDGDMSPCIGLKKAVFENRKHYSHTYEEINKINQK